MITFYNDKDIEIKISNTNIDYLEALNFMKHRVKNILNNKEKELIWFLNHDHMYTCGTSADKNEILSKTHIPIIKTNRGGRTTYHGPGQRIVYFMINLNKRKKDIRKFINIIEKSTFMLLQDIGIEAKTFPKRVGIWVTKSNNIFYPKEKKIGAIGLRITKWITYHGLSFNINPDLKYYDAIHACGLKDYSSTSLNNLQCNLSSKEFDAIYLKYFIQGLRNF